MKRIIFILSLLVSVASVAQPPGYTLINQRYDWLAGKFTALHVPAGGATPALKVGQYTGAGAVIVDSVNHKFYFYSGATFRELLKASDSTAKWFSYIYRRNDSVFGCKNSSCSLLFKDSTGGGGGGTPIANTLPIYKKTISGSENLFVNEAYIRDGGGSANLANYNLNRVNASVLSSDFTDGIFAFNWRDSLMVQGAGWNTTPATTDTVRTSPDGVTWTFKSKLPYPVHTIAHVEGDDGYYYFLGADYLSTATQQKTVYRTSDFSTYTTMTTNAGFGSRILPAAWKWNGDLYVGGGQNDLTGSIRYNDIWKSTDGGATWTLFNAQAIASNGDSVMIGNAYNSVVVYNRALYRVMVNVYPATSNKRVYKSLDGGLSWTRISDYPLTGASYPSSIVWDGKLWVLAGYNGSANTSNIVYLDKTDTWHVYPNHINSTFTDTLTPTHAGDLIVFRDQVYSILGNNKNTIISLYRSNRSQGFTFIDTIRANKGTFLGEGRGGKERGFFGKNVRPSTVNSDKWVHTSSDAGVMIGVDYSDNFGVFVNIDATPNTEYSDTLYSALRIDANGNARITKGYYNFNPGSSYALGVNGRLWVKSTNNQVGVFQSTQSSAYQEFINSTYRNGFLDYTNNPQWDIYNDNGSGSATLAASLSNTLAKFVPLATGIPVDTTTYKVVVASSNGTEKKFVDWSFLTSGISGLSSASNLAGTGVGVYKTTTSGDAKFKRIIAGTNVTVTDMTDSIKIDASGSGGSATPAGNYGNVQLNRNGALATPASDSLDYQASTGLTVKNKINGTADVTITKPSGDLTVLYNANSAGGYAINELRNNGANYSYHSYVNQGAQTWDVGLYGSNDYKIRNVTGTKDAFNISATRGAALFGAIQSGTDLAVINSTNGQDAKLWVKSTGTGGYGVIKNSSTAGNTALVFFAAADGNNYLQSGDEAESGNAPLKLTGGSGGKGSNLMAYFNKIHLGANTTADSTVQITGSAHITGFLRVDSSARLAGGSNQQRVSIGDAADIANGYLLQVGSSAGGNQNTSNFVGGVKVDGSFTHATGQTATFNGTVIHNGGVLYAYAAKTTTYSIAATDYVIDCTSGTFTVTLPTAVGKTGQVFIVKNTGAGTITIATTSSQTIDGTTTQSLTLQNSGFQMMSDGANWKIIGSF